MHGNSIEQVSVLVRPPSPDVNLVVRLHNTSLHRDDILDVLHGGRLDVFAFHRTARLSFFEIEQRFLTDHHDLLSQAEHRLFHLDLERHAFSRLDLCIGIFDGLVTEQREVDDVGARIDVRDRELSLEIGHSAVIASLDRDIDAGQRLLGLAVGHFSGDGSFRVRLCTGNGPAKRDRE